MELDGIMEHILLYFEVLLDSTPYTRQKASKRHHSIDSYRTEKTVGNEFRC